MSKIILASKSSVRQKTLKDAGIEFEAIPSDIDEEVFKQDKSLDPFTIIKNISKAKAEKVSQEHKKSYCIGADQGLIFKNELFSKAKNINELEKRLLKMRGNEHFLANSLHVFKNGKQVWEYQDKVTLQFRGFSDQFIKDYLDKSGESILSSVGGYCFEKMGIQLFEKVKGDYFSILGFPIIPVLSFLRGEGVIQT